MAKLAGGRERVVLKGVAQVQHALDVAGQDVRLGNVPERRGRLPVHDLDQRLARGRWDEEVDASLDRHVRREDTHGVVLRFLDEVRSAGRRDVALLHRVLDARKVGLLTVEEVLLDLKVNGLAEGLRGGLRHRPALHTLEVPLKGAGTVLLDLCGGDGAEGHGAY